MPDLPLDQSEWTLIWGHRCTSCDDNSSAIEIHSGQCLGCWGFSQNVLDALDYKRPQQIQMLRKLNPGGKITMALAFR